MVILKKVKASTLMETLVATVIILIIFIISSLILNNVFGNLVSNDLQPIKTKMLELEYGYKNGKLQLPYQEDNGEWLYSLQKMNDKKVWLKAENYETGQLLTEELYENK